MPAAESREAFSRVGNGRTRRVMWPDRQPSVRPPIHNERMARFSSKYSDEQKEAVALAYLDRGIRPASNNTAQASGRRLWHGPRSFCGLRARLLSPKPA
jgi:hypothetical protein